MYIPRKHCRLCTAQHIITNPHRNPNKINKLVLCLDVFYGTSALKASLALLPSWVSKRPVVFRRERCIKMTLQASRVLSSVRELSWGFFPLMWGGSLPFLPIYLWFQALAGYKLFGPLVENFLVWKTFHRQETRYQYRSGGLSPVPTHLFCTSTNGYHSCFYHSYCSKKQPLKGVLITVAHMKMGLLT